MGNPFLLEDMLAKHPKLKIWVMHAGYPMINEMIALMGAHGYVYVDVAGMIWSYPLAEVNDYIKRLVQAASIIAPYLDHPLPGRYLQASTKGQMPFATSTPVQ